MYKKTLSNILFLSLLLLFIVCAYQLIHLYDEKKDQEMQLAKIQMIIEQAASDESCQSPEKAIKTLQDDQERAAKFWSYQYLKEENNDYIGWISIPDTNIDYPVLQNKEYPEYYLKRNFNKNKSPYGSVYMDSACTINESMNYIIYGHHMKDGTMFAALNNYQEESYYREHPVIHFDTLSETGNYEIMAAFKIPAQELDQLSSFILFNNQEQFNQLIDFIDSHKLYHTDITCAYGDQLLTLMTCEYSYKNGRLLIVAKRK